MAGQVGDPEHLHEHRAALPALMFAQVESLKDRLQISLNGETAKNGGFLGEVTEASARPEVNRGGGQIFAVHENLSLIGADETDHHMKSRGFSRSVGPEQPYHLTSADLQADPIDHAATIIRLRDPFSLENDHCPLLGLACSFSRF